MAEKKITVPKPKKPNPHPVKPRPIKPVPIETPKAHLFEAVLVDGKQAHCSRCNNPLYEKGTVRQVCATCDFTLQEMHWQNEHVMFRRTFYLPEPKLAVPSLEWLQTNGYEVTKPPKPRYRQVWQPEAAQAMVM